jgi:peptidoglycan hydrolase-like protein with peptidoglycan-binding domain
MFTRLAVTAAVALAATLTIAPAVAQAASVWDAVAACESGGNWAINTGNGFYGGLQFTHQTWQGYGGGVYSFNANGASRAAQITIAQRVLVGQGPGAWPVCGPRGGLTRANGGGNVYVPVTVSRSGVRAPITGRLAVDGILGPLTRAEMNRARMNLSTRSAVIAWQHRLHVTADGVVGPVTTRAIQSWLNTIYR